MSWDRGSDLHHLALRHTPVLLLDRAEPFRVEGVGYAVLDRGTFSPTFPRRLMVEPPACQVIEYAIEWDADIGHLYELEHVWVYLDREGMVVRVEASWHGTYREMVADGRIPLEDGHPILYVEPGKHAMAPSPTWFQERSARTLRECTRLAGAGGIWLNPLYGFPAIKSPQTDRLARTYLRRKAFTPTWIFDRRLEISPELLRPIRELLFEIPRRLQTLIERLERDIPEEERDLLIIAHRGASAKAPENTLAAIRQAAMDDADAVELDVQVTADGIPVLHHDAEVRWLDGTLRPLGDVFLSELRIARPEIPTLAEALELCREVGLGAYLDLKAPEAVEPAALIVQQTGMLPFVIFGAREPVTLHAVRRVLPWAYRSIMFEGLETDPIALAEAADAHYVHPCWEGRSARPEEQLTSTWVKRVHASGLGIISWHEEQPIALKALKAVGVDAVTTDRPDLAAQVFRSKGA
ncbi:Glycerophosphodiester phosphodiesterase, cytoplasmic [Candidatus Thermoflexus japonica]|uniref:Glycerophosphodiester phosphodiesterase, cytoplasmic n=1 Tax=Candidatus Thermoflexus japonica TaxID=2035417 RepID=A0A2H5Y436_9CHLR|nr:Glycerophosphodiester phosphodiesterase, cytoplasmic [Candidatus Thermoflexus japonica]